MSYQKTADGCPNKYARKGAKEVNKGRWVKGEGDFRIINDIREQREMILSKGIEHWGGKWKRGGGFKTKGISPGLGFRDIYPQKKTKEKNNTHKGTRGRGGER